MFDAVLKMALYVTEVLENLSYCFYLFGRSLIRDTTCRGEWNKQTYNRKPVIHNYIPPYGSNILLATNILLQEIYADIRVCEKTKNSIIHLVQKLWFDLRNILRILYLESNINLINFTTEYLGIKTIYWFG